MTLAEKVARLMVEVRLDNDEVISTRPLTLIERNAVLPFEEDV